MQSTRGLFWFRRAALLAAILCAIVVVVGAWVRLTNAGLGCPDWPGCYGHILPSQLVDRVAEINADNPERPFDYQKALNEMVHRYIVGALGILVLALAALSVWNRRDPAQPRILPWVIVVLLVLQALLGMWTVTLLLKPLIVTLHLLGGLTTLALLWWLALPPERRELKAAERPVRRLAAAAAGPARITPPRPVPIFPPATASGGRTWISRTVSCCGADSGSITKAACSTRRRASRSITRTGSART
jgi:cytochrome c oxidase assembly protein subunit 15